MRNRWLTLSRIITINTIPHLNIMVSSIQEVKIIIKAKQIR